MLLSPFIGVAEGRTGTPPVHARTPYNQDNDNIAPKMAGSRSKFGHTRGARIQVRTWGPRDGNCQRVLGISG